MSGIRHRVIAAGNPAGVHDARHSRLGAAVQIRPGLIYVLRNEHMQHLVKIGKTTRTAEGRARELARPTGVAGKFEVLLDEYVADVDAAERLVHARLSKYRIQSNREFFDAPCPLALRTAFATCAEVNRDVSGRVTRIRILFNGRTDVGRLKDLLAHYRGGEVLVVVHYLHGSAKCEITLGSEWGVVFSLQLAADLQEWLGSDAVLFVRGGV